MPGMAKAQEVFPVDVDVIVATHVGWYAFGVFVIRRGERT